MNDPFWNDLDKALPRARRGEAGWAHQRGKVLSAIRGGSAAPRRLAGWLAAGTLAAALVLVFRHKPAPAPGVPPVATTPAEDLDFLEAAPLLEHLDELLEAPELDRA